MLSRESRSGRSLDVRIPSAIAQLTPEPGQRATTPAPLVAPSTTTLGGPPSSCNATPRFQLETSLSKKFDSVKSPRKKDPHNAVAVIERAWLTMRDKQLFALLKNSICAAEASLSMEILRRVCPKEAILLNDKSINSKVRLRFGGSEFPPHIYFKIFVSDPSIRIQYISGKTMIVPASEAARDACCIMGNRKFYDQVISDELQRRSNTVVSDVADVVTLKDYMQYLSILDESPACRGGRENQWRKLSMESVPRRTMFYDVLSFVETRKLTDDLISNLPILIEYPLNQDIQLQQIKLISQLRDLPLNYDPNTRPLVNNDSNNNNNKWSKRAVKSRAEKMKRLYSSQLRSLSSRESTGKSEPLATPPPTRRLAAASRLVDSVNGKYSLDNISKQNHNQDEEEEEDEAEARELYEWTLTL